MEYHYKQKFLVGYGEVDQYNKLRLSSLLNFLQDVATMHSKTLGYGTSECLELGIGWLLLSWHLKMYSYPEGDSTIEVRTWSRGIKGIHASRAYEILDEKGNLVAEADSIWALVDIKARKPIRPLPGMAEAYSAIDRKPFENEKIKIIEPEIIDDKASFKIQRRDIDTNRHCNNTKYIEYAIETIPEEIYSEKHIEELEIVYKKQVIYNENIEVTCSKVDSNEFINVIKNENGEITTSIKTKWKIF
ncbi:MAG: hypothetical protein IJ220_02390 [Clostridia bacterium]|nr:hypothetical protein [Clostridia bacterium]